MQKSRKLSNLLEINEFKIRVRDWLTPKGFKEIYSNNHPTPDNVRIDYIKGNIRVQCFKKGVETYCRLSYTVHSKLPCSLISVRLGIETEMLDVSLQNFKDTIEHFKQ